jgi:hypothetical protein
VDTLKLVDTNDNVAENSTVVKNENSTITAKIVISIARPVELKLLVAKVVIGTRKGTRAFEDLDSTDSVRDVKGLAEGGGGESQRSESLSEMHFQR